MLVEFSLTCIFHHIWKNLFNLRCSHSQKVHLNLCIFTHAQAFHSKLQVEVFEHLFPPRRKGWRKLWSALSKFNQKKWRWLETLVYLYFVWFTIFLNVMALQFWEYLSNSVVLSLMPPLYNYGNLTLKLHQKI